jgi:hypothetical protein
MTVTVTTILAGPFYPNGETTAFPFDFKVPSASEISVFSVASDLEEPVAVSPSLYSVEIATDGEGGTVRFASAPSDELGALFLEVAPLFNQQANFNNTGFLPRSLNPNFDRAVIRDLWLKARADRAVTVPFGEQGFSIPFLANRAGRLPVFSQSGQLATLDAPETVVTIDASGEAVGMPVIEVLQAMGTDIIDDGAWGDGSVEDDGAFG